MTHFLMLDDEQMEILAFAVSTTITDQRRKLTTIMQERITRIGDGHPDVTTVKASHHDALIKRIYRLEAVSRTLDGTPDTGDPAST